MSNDYYYELKYVDEDTQIIYKFDAMVVKERMEERLFDFLRACSWDDRLLKKFRLGGR